MKTRYCYHPTPVGPLLLAGEDATLTLLGFPAGSMARRPEPQWRQDAGPFREVSTQLDEYFAGERKTFDLALAPRGTPFQQEVWEALRAIPYGDTCNYGQLARRLGRPSASRAVGQANGRNPLPVIVPCHRVIGANGNLTGFGGSLDTKRYLLELEAKHRNGKHSQARPGKDRG